MPGYIASRRKPLIYLNMPKSACTSFKNWIYFLDNGKYYNNPLDIHNVESQLFIHYNAQRSKLIDRFYDSFVFTFVRHPLKRAYSLYAEKLRATGPHSFEKVRDLLVKRYGAKFEGEAPCDAAPTEGHADLGREQNNFLAFLRFVSDTQHKRIAFRRDWHWMPQTVVLENALAVRPLDFIGRIETIDQDFEFVCKKGQCEPKDLPRFNEAPSPPYSYDQILSDEIVELGREIYADDLRNLAYRI